MAEAVYITYLALYVLTLNFVQSNSRSSTLWQLNAEEGKIVEVQFPRLVSLPGDTDPIFNIITSTHRLGKSWTKGGDYYCSECLSHETLEPSTNEHVNESRSWDSAEDYLDCGKPVNFTYYDNLVGVANRNNHPHAPEPQVALVFKKKQSKNVELDVNALERKLKKAKREKPKSVQLYNQLGNFWRIKGDARRSIECFRRALAVSPHNAEVLLNLARVLFNLQYLDDAIYLTRRSLEVQPPDRNAWQQYLTLGEIFKAYGHYQEAALHLRHALELRPALEPALQALAEMEALPDATIHVYTLLIIVCLVLGVLLVVLSSVDGSLEAELVDARPQRHFNRAMAMRSLRMGISPRALRTKRS